MCKPDALNLSAESANAIMVMVDNEIEVTLDGMTVGKNEAEDYHFLARKVKAYGEYLEWYEQQDCSETYRSGLKYM